jgi:hypothetical protein
MVTHFACPNSECSRHNVPVSYSTTLFRRSMNCSSCGTLMKSAETINTSHKGPSGKRFGRSKSNRKGRSK